MSSSSSEELKVKCLCTGLQYDCLVPVLHGVTDAEFLGGLDPISSIRSTLALHLTFRFTLSMNIDELALEIAYLTHLLIY